MKLTSAPWGSHNGQDVFLFHLESNAVKVSVSNFGATITAISTPDRDNKWAPIVLGYNNLQGYIDDEFYVGSTVGRFAGRIGGAAFAIDEQLYNLVENDAPGIHLHGGKEGFNKKVFQLTRQELNNDEAVIELHYYSAHLEEGFPGNLDVWITYKLTADGRLTVGYRANTDQATHISLTNHSYFNLAGKGDVLDHQLFINADECLVNNAQHVPTGSIFIDGTPYSFKPKKAVGANIGKLAALGYNQCYILNHPEQLSASLYHPESGRELLLTTNFPGIVLYTGDYLSAPFFKNAGLCLETQYYPDAPNHPVFPSTLLRPEQEWEHFASFRFGVR